MGQQRENDAPLLSFRDVEVCYENQPVLRNVSFELYPGEILGIAGESGSGKSTILKAILGILGNTGVVTRGEIQYHGTDLATLSEREMRRVRGARIGMIFQDAGASLCPVRTIGSQICESVRAHRDISRGEIKREALEMFEKLNFRDTDRIWNSYPFELSGGMNQRVGIAIAMLSKPQILLADEPTSALDVIVQKQIVQEMLRVRELFGTAIMLVTHDIGVVAAMADRVLILKGGTIMECGEAWQVLHEPQNAYTKRLLAAVPRIKSGPESVSSGT